VTVEELIRDSTKASGVLEFVEDVVVLAKLSRVIRDAEEVMPIPTAS
jgi:hypothetical protein